MTPTLTLHRGYFFIVLWFTLWVGSFGFFRPQEILRALPWPVPPLHARIVGAMYLAATVFLLLSLLARTRLQVRTVVDIAFVWTSWLLLVSSIHWDSFDLAREQVWFWLVAYVSFPIGAAWLAWGSPPLATPDDTLIGQPWVLHWLRLQGAALVLLALALTLQPNWVAGYWPWPLPVLLAQIYAGPVLGFGVGSLLLAARRNWPETLIPSVGMAVFALAALLGSSWHPAAFAANTLATRVWFGVLLVLAAASLSLVALALHQGHRAGWRLLAARSA